MTHSTPVRRARQSEQGYLLVWVMFLLVVFAIGLSVAVPRAAKEIQHDRELETMHRGKQYIRAEQLYYRRFHAYPPNANALVNTNQIRFLRKKYLDPITSKDDWKPILWGQAKTQTTGFFGQPIAGLGSAGGSTLAGIGPSGGSGLGSLGPGGSGSSALFGSGSGSNSGSLTPGGSAGSSGAAGTGSGSSGSSGTSSFGSSSNSASSSQTFGGAGIIGFSPAGTKTSIFIYRKKQHYNEWEFIYDPATDLKTISGNTGTVGQPASSTSSPAGTSSFGSSGSSFGSGGGFGSSPTPVQGSGTTPTPQPQL